MTQGRLVIGVPSRPPLRVLLHGGGVSLLVLRGTVVADRFGRTRRRRLGCSLHLVQMPLMLGSAARRMQTRLWARGGGRDGCLVVSDRIVGVISVGTERQRRLVGGSCIGACDFVEFGSRRFLRADRHALLIPVRLGQKPDTTPQAGVPCRSAPRFQTRDHSNLLARLGGRPHRFAIRETAEIPRRQRVHPAAVGRGGRVTAISKSGSRLSIDGAVLAEPAEEIAADGERPSFCPASRESGRNRLPGLVTRVVRDPFLAQVEMQAGPFRIV